MLLFLGEDHTGFLSSQNYRLLSNKTSPNGKYVITEYASVTEGGHAPYGQHLVLTTNGAIKDPEHGYVIFAGYCDPAPNYYWGSNSNVVVECKVDSGRSIRTGANLAFGIKVEIVAIEK
jgi:hypothetical protein